MKIRHLNYLIEAYLPYKLLIFIKSIKKAKSIKSEAKYNICKHQIDEMEGNNILFHLNNQKCIQ